MLPISCPYQDVLNVKIDWPGTFERERKGTVDVVKMKGNARDGEAQTAVISYDVNLRSRKPRWESPIVNADLEPQDDIGSRSVAFAALYLPSLMFFLTIKNAF